MLQRTYLNSSAAAGRLRSQASRFGACFKIKAIIDLSDYPGFAKQ